MTDEQEPAASISPAQWKPTFFASLAGIAVGLFFGDYCNLLAPLAQAYIGLLQMTVLPLVVAMLIAGLGRLNPAQARSLTFWVMVTMGGLWLTGCAAVVVGSYALPPWQGGQFYSPNLVSPPAGPSFLDLYIPSNLFSSLAGGSVPAVVLFCVFFGVSLMTMPNKGAVIGLLDTIVDTLTQVNRIVLRVNPIGIFVLSAQAAGTLQFHVLEKLEFYFVVKIVMLLMLTFWVLPQLIAIFTPFGYRETLSVSWAFLITVAAVGKLIVVFPMILDASRTLFERHKAAEPDADSTLEAVIPVAYPFPGVGDFAALYFIPFAAWYVGSAFTLFEFPKFLTMGLLSSFASPSISIPFLLSERHIPLDLFHLFLVSGVYLQYFGRMLAAMDLFATGLIATAAIHGVTRFQWRRAVWFAVLTAAMSAGGVVAMRIYAEHELTSSKTAPPIMGMQPLRSDVKIAVHKSSSPNPVPLTDGQSRLDRVRQTGVLRVGYNAGSLPFSFFNSYGQLTGLDIDTVATLANDLGVRAELYPFEKGKLAESLRWDHFDLAVSDLTTSLYRDEQMVLTRPYLQLHIALVVPDERVAEFRSLRAIRAMRPLRVGAVEGSVYAERAHRLFPDAKVVLYQSDEGFFHGEEKADVLLTSAEVGAGWTLQHANYEVVHPFAADYKAPLAYAIGRVEGEDFGVVLGWREFLNNWLQMRIADGTVDELYQYWVRGAPPATRQKRRWSVLHDVLGWPGGGPATE